MNRKVRSFTYYFDLVWRRKKYFLLTSLVIGVASLLVAFSLPRTFRSTATLLMDVPVPKTTIQSSLIEYGGDQVKSISQKVMTTRNVLAIIAAENLYPDAVGHLGQDRLIEQFKGNTEIQLLKSDLADQRDASTATSVAFTISFLYTEADKAKQVTSRLAELFIEQNDRERTQSATRVVDFLSTESEKLSLEIEAIDAKISAYKKLHKDNLPEQLQGNLSALDRKTGEIRDTEQQIRLTTERINFLSVELAKTRQIEPPPPLNNSDAPLPRAEVLKALKARYIKLSGMYSPLHPDVISVKRQIDALDPDAGSNSWEEDIREQLLEARHEVHVLKQQSYADTHPSVVALNHRIVNLEQQLSEAEPRLKQKSEIVTESRGNPTLLLVEAQYKTSQLELEALQRKVEFLKAELETLHQRVLTAPEVEKGYLELLRERDRSLNKYNQLKEKFLDAKLVKTLEEEQHGQTLTILEPPTVPTHPDKAVRRKVALGGMALALAAGLGSVFLVELLDPRVRGYLALSELTGLMPLVVIPYVESPGEVEQRLLRLRQRRRMLQIGASCFLLAILLVFLLAFSSSFSDRM